jgi:ABC-2 type transport system ATP-binding protein
VSHAVEIDSLAVNFGNIRAVDNVSLRVEFGEIHVVLGPNGAGKTTAVETLLGFRSPTSGSVRLMGLDPVRDHQKVVERVGALLQRGGVWSSMSPRQVLQLTASYYAAPREVNELTSALQLDRCASTSWRRLSGGEQQRTLLALALVGRPRVLVLDEPTSAVDPEGHRAVREILKEQRERGCAILITTHELADAEALADAVTVIADGRVAQCGTLSELTGDAVLIVETSIDVDTAAIAAALGVEVTLEAARTYRIDAPNSPAILSTLQTFLSTQNAALTSLRTRATLEESYLAIVQRSKEVRS